MILKHYSVHIESLLDPANFRDGSTTEYSPVKCFHIWKQVGESLIVQKNSYMINEYLIVRTVLTFRSKYRPARVRTRLWQPEGII